jgi:serine protease
MSTNTLIGCDNDPSSSRPCVHESFKDYTNHGTHVSGTISARLNGVGVVGVVSGGARLRMENVFGSGDGTNDDEIITAISNCAKYLDYLKATTRLPYRMVVSMSLGGPGFSYASNSIMSRLYARGDIMFAAAAGNDGDKKAPPFEYPAGYSSCISVAAVDARRSVASFSTWNSKVELAAPGVAVLSTMSTTPVPGKATLQATLQVFPLPSGYDAAMPVYPADSSGQGSRTGQLIDCGLGTSTCQGASNKVCLIQRGVNNFCEKVHNCVLGGGIAAVIYNRADLDTCEVLDGFMLWDSTCPRKVFPPTIGLTRAQGEALRAALRQGQYLTATVSVRPGGVARRYGAMSGTSMATPHVAAVAGLVWAAFPNCRNSDVRRALQVRAGLGWCCGCSSWHLLPSCWLGQAGSYQLTSSGSDIACHALHQWAILRLTACGDSMQRGAFDQKHLQA